MLVGMQQCDTYYTYVGSSEREEEPQRIYSECLFYEITFGILG